MGERLGQNKANEEAQKRSRLVRWKLSRLVAKIENETENLKQVFVNTTHHFLFNL